MKYKRKVLKNGLRLIMIPMPDSPTVTVLSMVEAGSKYESKRISGLSHFLEHMCFKGTTKRPTALDISKELDAIGSQYNAFTSEEFTGYYAKSAPKHVSKILDVVADLYLNPVFDVKEMEKEKGVIIEEINMYRDLPHRHVQELFSTLLYGDQPAGWSVAGTKETVQMLTRDDVVKYRKEHYVGSATTVIIAGNFDERKILKEVQEKFGSLPQGPKTGKPKVFEKQDMPDLLVESRTTDQSHLVLGVRGYPLNHQDTAAIRVMNAVLGGGMSSRLFQKLREEMGVGYYVRSSYDALSDHGIFSVSVGVDVKRIEEVIKAILVEFKLLKSKQISSEELNKTKEYLIGNMALSLESSDELAEFYGFQEIMNRPLKMPATVAQEIKAVTATQIQAVAKKLFTNKRLNVAIVGPVKDQDALRSIFSL